MNEQIKALETGIQQIMAGAKRRDPAREMPSDAVWQRQAQQILEQRSAGLLAALSEQELMAVASGKVSMMALWQAI